MSRNTSGVYSLPSGNPVVSGTLIESTWANPTMNDIAAAITASLPRDGSAGMTGPLVLARNALLDMEPVPLGQFNDTIGSSANFMPAGAIQYFAANIIPAGWLLADGAAVSRSTYSQLFEAIGITYGAGNGTTTFNVPDLRGTFIRSADLGKGTDPGRVVGSVQPGSNQAHTHGATGVPHTHTSPAHGHGVNDPGHSHAVSGIVPGNQYSGSNQGALGAIYTSASATGVSIQATAVGITSATADVTIASSGGESRPVNVAMVACIRAYGSLQSGGIDTMAFQSKDNVAIAGGTGAFSALSCSGVPSSPNDVARLYDLAATWDPIGLFGSLKVNGADSVKFDVNGLYKDAVQGTITADNAALGRVGESRFAQVLQATPVVLTTGTAIQVTSLSLPPGDWDVTGHIGFNAAPTAVVSSVAAAIDSVLSLGADKYAVAQQVYVPAVTVDTSANGNPIISVHPTRINVAATTTVYLIARSAFTVSTVSAFGVISARRVR